MDTRKNLKSPVEAEEADVEPVEKVEVTQDRVCGIRFNPDERQSLQWEGANECIENNGTCLNWA